MSKIATIVKPILPIISAVYGLALIYLTALPIADGGGSLAKESLTWFLTLLAILLTVFVVIRIERTVYPESRQFSLKPPTLAVAVGLILIAPLWLVTQEAVVYGLTSMIHSVQTELLVYSSEDFREDMLATRIAVCLLMALLFGMHHVRNFIGASLAALLFGLVFIWSRNIWYAILLHAGSNLTGTLLGIYAYLGLGNIQTCKIPVIYLPDTKAVIACLILATTGGLILYKKKR